MVSSRLMRPMAANAFAGKAARLELVPDRTQLAADGSDLSFVTVRIVDADGLLVPRSHPLVQFSIEGPGELVAVGNGDATSWESFQADHRKAYNGLCLAILKRRRGETGDIRLTATSDGLETASTLISGTP